MKKIIRRLTLLIIISLHLTFLAAILFEKINTWWLISCIVFISAAITYAYYRHDSDEEEHFLLDLQDIALVAVGAIFTYFLNIQTQMGPVIAAALIGTIASFIPNLFKKSSAIKKIPAPIYCGTFVGMCAQQIAGGYSFILFASLLAGALFIGAKNLFNGYGGKLGTIAFGGVALCSLIAYLVF